MRAKPSEADLFWPLVLLAFLAVIVIAISGLALLAEFDRAAAAREETVISNGLRGRIAEIAHLTVGEVVWDDAVRHLDNHFDIAWTRQNIGLFFWQNCGFEASFIISPERQTIFAAINGNEAPAATFAPFAREAAPLIATVRAEEARQTPFKAHTDIGQALAEPTQSNTLANIGGRIYILTVSLVRPDFGAATPRGPVAPILVAAMRIDGTFIQTFANRYLLTGLRLQSGAPGRRLPPASMVLRNLRGDPVGIFQWLPQRPGRALLHHVGLPALGILLAVIGGIVLLYRRARRIAAELVTSEARATHMAYHDSLTGLPNRLLFHDRLSHALGRARRTGEVLAVFCVDLDRFKQVNDTYGHHAGDELIQKAGRLMLTQCRAADTVARMSGDEFSIIQTEASVATAAALATRLSAGMREPIDLETGRVFIGCSIGITIVTDPGLPPAEILRQADVALYRAKERVKGQFCFFEPDMDATMKFRRSLEEDLRAALAGNALHMAYQPQVNERTGLTGVEALLRWRHPVRGDLSPAFFVSVAEECGLIAELGMFAMRRAFEDSRRWKHLKVAINISPKQLRMSDFADKVAALVAELGVNPRQFEFEITEGILLGDDPETLVLLNRLRDTGFELALDDFGTGYSSLSYLQRYPINRIKIDRSFIANLGVADEAEEFITAIVRLARALKLSVIAEGVETAAQHLALTMSGCVDMQGYRFGPPTSAAEIDRLVNRVPSVMAAA